MAEDSGHGMQGVESSTPRCSSSPELSTPPRSSPDPASPAAAQLEYENRNAQESSIVVDTTINAPPVRKKPGRKPGSTKKALAEAHAAALAAGELPKQKRGRKPRDPNLPPIVRKRKSAVDAQDSKTTPDARQSKITDLHMRPSDPGNSANSNTPIASQNGKSEDIPKPITSFFSTTPAQPQLQQWQETQSAPSSVRTSGQNYDPIRSSNYDPVRETVVSHNPFSAPQPSPKPPTINRASASPSLSSLVDPPFPSSTSPSLAAHSFFKLQSHDGPTSVPASPTNPRLVPSPLMSSTTLGNQAAAVLQADAPADENMRASAPPATFVAEPKSPVMDSNKLGSKQSPVHISKSTNTSSTAASPKAIAGVDVSPPPLPGSSFMRSGPDDGTESKAPTIILHIPLKGETNKYVNFTRMAEERYGWDALHPRLAAQRERLARVAAAGAALEKSGAHRESGDEMSLDLSEGEGSNVEMGGMSDGRTGTDVGAKKPTKKRKTKEDEYDKDDGFVDDSETLWEEQAAASKDGFFVYSGPLVPEGEKPQFETPAAPVKRGRGGGRGRGRGGAAAAKAKEAGEKPTPSTRGGTTTRKPRVTKADRARMEQEKADREKQGLLAARPGSFNNMMMQNATSGGTPMVFSS